jgi:hypothetical protein
MTPKIREHTSAACDGTGFPKVKQPALATKSIRGGARPVREREGLRMPNEATLTVLPPLNPMVPGGTL